MLWVETTSLPFKLNGIHHYYVESWTVITKHKRLKENLQFYITETTKAQEEERKRIARELHDDTAQTLLSLGINIETMIRTEKGIPEHSIQRLRDFQSTIDIVEGNSLLFIPNIPTRR